MQQMVKQDRIAAKQMLHVIILPLKNQHLEKMRIAACDRLATWRLQPCKKRVIGIEGGAK
jgi:hypothetical protein